MDKFFKCVTTKYRSDQRHLFQLKLLIPLAPLPTHVGLGIPPLLTSENRNLWTNFLLLTWGIIDKTKVSIYHVTY